MPKFFVISDIHGFYSIMKKALDEAGFDPNNKDHYLISLGDAFDRGNECNEVLDFLLSLNRKILIRGNHEDLLEYLCERKYWKTHDIVNGTMNTISQFSNFLSDNIEEVYNTALQKVTPYLKQLINYYETEKYVFVHGWIPIIKHFTYFGDERYEYLKNWRNAEDKDWEAARWFSGIQGFEEKLLEPNKTIICGHWHVSEAHSKFHNIGSEFGEDACFDIFKMKGYL